MSGEAVAVLEFVNGGVESAGIKFSVERAAIPDIVSWYCGFWSGEPVSVLVDGVRQDIHKDYGLVGGKIAEGE